MNDQTSSSPTQSGKKSSKKQFSIKTLVLAAVFLGLIGLAGWSFYNYQQAERKILELSSVEGQQKLAANELNELLERVKVHMMLPEDEEPTVASVTDVEKLKEEQPFFAQAQNGDKVIIYSKSLKAIIYSPERDVIVNVGTIYVGDNQVSQQEIDEMESEVEPTPETGESEE